MSNYVRVSCVSGPALQVAPEHSFQDVVEMSLAQWGSRLADVLPDKPDVIVLPEAMDRPDVACVSVEWQREYFSHRGNQVRDFLSEIARQNQCAITYSAQQDVPGGSTRNSTCIIDRNGVVVSRYDKNFLVTDENSVMGLEYGQEPSVVELEFGRVGSIICFDLNFIELLEQYRALTPRLVLFSSEYHGGLMQSYWAYRLGSYFAGSIRPPAPSGVVSPLGETVAESTNYFDHVSTVINLDYAVVHLDSLFAKLHDLKRAYGPSLSIHDPGRLGSVLISSESDEFTVDEVLRDASIDPLSVYLDKARMHREENLR